MDGEGEALLRRIEEAFVAGGYNRAREPRLSPFDKITGGLAWFVSASKVDVDYEYSDDFVLGDKIHVAESIALALQRMECPLPLHAHQIQGLDYHAIYPVVEWLAKRLRNELPDQVAMKSSHIQRRDERRDHELESATGSKWKAEVHSSDSPEDASTRAVYEDGNAYDERIAALQHEIQCHKEKLSSLKRGIDTEQNRSLNGDMEKLRTVASDYERLDNVLATLKALKAIGTEKVALLEASICEKEKLPDSSLLDTTAEPGDENGSEKKNNLQKELAKVTRALVLLQRRVDDVPTQAELIQYERCFMELYVNIQAKLRETRKYFASYNALAEVHELSLKEASLLNSINSQYEMAMSTSQGRAKFVESLQGISTGVEKRLKTMEVRCTEKSSACSALREKHGAALAKRRQYYALIKQLQEEFAQNENLQEADEAM